MATLAPTSAPIAQKAKSALFGPIGKEQWRQFGNWVLVWLVLANIGFAAMWFVGAPPRNPEIMASGAIGLVVRTMPFWVRCVGFLAAITYSILGFIAGLFSLSISSLLYSLKFFLEIKPTQSADYIVGAGLLLAVERPLVGQCATGLLLDLHRERRNDLKSDDARAVADLFRVCIAV